MSLSSLNFTKTGWNHHPVFALPQQEVFNVFMKHRLGIGGKLLLAFGSISMLTVASALVGWFAFDRAGRVQDAVVNKTVPFLNQALSLSEISHRIIAASPSLTGANTEARRAAEATELFKQVRNLRQRMQNLKQASTARNEINPLRKTTGRMIANLIRQNDLVKKRISLQMKFASQSTAAQKSVSQIVKISGALVSNAVTTTTATVANLYDMVEAKDQKQTIYKTLDRLIEYEIDLLERMFELRHRSAVMGLLIGQLERTASPDEIGPLKADYVKHLKIVERRVLNVSDPYRKGQAEAALASLRINRDIRDGASIFALREQILQINVSIAELARLNRSLSGELRLQVENLVSRSRNELQLAAAGSNAALDTGRLTLLLIAAFSLAIATLIAWFYVRRKVANRIVALSGVTGELARGNLTVEVHDTGNDELSDMAGVLKVFKSNALAKERLEEEQKETEAELRRHKQQLEHIVSERTAQLKEANLRLSQEVENHEKARQLAEQANRAKTAFLAAMSHEIRTPITGILGTLHLFDEEGLSKGQKKRLGIIRGSGETLLSIISDILDYSKIEAGHLDIVRTDFDICLLVDDLVSLMEISSRGKGLQLSAEISKDVPRLLKGDPGHVRQVLINLVGNAIKFTRKGKVVVRVARVKGKKGIPLRFEVEDTGIGISSAEQKHLFEAFYQTQTPSGQRAGGTGLGLSICSRLVSAMGGEIGVNSKKGHGSTFWMQLIFEPGQAENLAAGLAMLPSGARVQQPLKVLLVEDNPVISEIAEAFLQRDGHFVALAGDGEKALTRLAKDDFDVILMDISLPGISGQETTRLIRAQKDAHKKNLPIIAMSAHVFREEINDYLAAGMNAFLGKPFSPDQLNAVLQLVIHDRPKSPIVLDGKMMDKSGENAAVFDSSVLEEDLDILGEKRVLRMVDLFLSSAEQSRGTIANSLKCKDWSGLRSIAHLVKSSAGSLGLMRLHHLAQEVELATRNRDDREIEKQAALLPELISQSCQALKSFKSDLVV